MSKLYFFNSVMNSGKSAHIIMQVYNLQEKGKKVLILKPSLDTREFGKISSRALNTELEANLIYTAKDIVKYVEEVKPDIIFVDEANFLTADEIETLAYVVDNLNIPIHCYGLMLDFKSNLFEGSKRLVELADTVRELKSPCSKCNKKATHHLRKINGNYVFSGEVIQVGDMDEYESVCRKCFMQAKTDFGGN